VGVEKVTSISPNIHHLTDQYVAATANYRYPAVSRQRAALSLAAPTFPAASKQKKSQHTSLAPPAFSSSKSISCKSR
jgi:hypothetical protein